MHLAIGHIGIFFKKQIDCNRSSLRAHEAYRYMHIDQRRTQDVISKKSTIELQFAQASEVCHRGFPNYNGRQNTTDFRSVAWGENTVWLTYVYLWVDFFLLMLKKRRKDITVRISRSHTYRDVHLILGIYIYLKISKYKLEWCCKSSSNSNVKIRE